MKARTHRNILKEFAREKRNSSTLGETLLWKHVLSKSRLGYQFNRQFVIDRYIVDFVARKLKLIIEVDGYSHQFKVEQDLVRENVLKDNGYSILRFRERDVRYDLNNVVRAIVNYIEEFEAMNNPPNPLHQEGTRNTEG